MQEAQVEADVVADDERVARELEEVRDGLVDRGRLLDVLLGDAVELRADDGAAGLDQRRPAVGDLAALDLDRADLDDLAQLDVPAGGLEVEHDERLFGR